MKIFALIAVTLLLSIGMLFAAGGNEEEDGMTTITWWAFSNTFGIDGAFEQDLVDAFEAENPNIKVNLEMVSFADGPAKFETALASNTAPDLTYDAPGRIIAWGAEGVLAPLNDIIDLVKSDLATVPLQVSMGADGNYYMFPVHTGPFTMGFNKEMLEDLGVLDMLPYERGNRSWTLQEYEDLLRAINEKLPAGKVPSVFYTKSTAGDQGPRAFMVNLYGDAPLMDDDLTEYVYDGMNAVKNVEWLQMATDEGLMLNGSALAASDALDMYWASNAASTILFSLQLEKSSEAKIDYKGERFTSISMPFPNNEGGSVLEFLVGGPCVFDNGNAAKIAAAKKFVEFIATDDIWAPKVIAATGAFPVSDKVDFEITNDEQEWNAKVAPEFFGAYYNGVPSFGEMRTYWFPAMQAALSGENAKTVVDNFVDQSNAIQ